MQTQPSPETPPAPAPLPVPGKHIYKWTIYQGGRPIHQCEGFVPQMQAYLDEIRGLETPIRADECGHEDIVLEMEGLAFPEEFREKAWEMFSVSAIHEKIYSRYQWYFKLKVVEGEETIWS